MDEPETPAAFFRRFDRFRLAAQRGRSLLAIAIVVLLVGGGTGSLAWATATGWLFPSIRPAPVAARGHVVRTHGWGGYYFLGGRTHFGGGGSIH